MIGRAEFEVVLVVRDGSWECNGAANVVVRVKHEQQVGFAERVTQCFCAVVCEIDPRIAVQLAFNALGCEKILDNFAGCVGGSRVANDPVVKPDFGTQHGQRSANDVRLVLHDHVQTHGQLHGILIW